VSVTDCLLKCLVYRGGRKEGQFIKVNYHIHSRQGIMIIGPTNSNRTKAWFHQRQIPHRSLNSTTWVAYRAHGSVNSVSILILKHQHGLVTDCHWLPIVPIVLQSAPIPSAADLSIKV